MTDGGSHFIHGAFRKMLAKYDVNHRIASPYHPQSSGQVELTLVEKGPFVPVRKGLLSRFWNQD